MNQKSLFGPVEKKVVFDLETQRSFDEVGGRANIHQLGISLGVLYDYNSDKYITYTDETVNELVDELLSASLVIGFNSEGFDYRVLYGYRPDIDFLKLPSLDMLKQIHRTMGFRISLDNLAQSTLGKGKSANGLDALRWYREGKMDLIEKYCRDDVAVTRAIYEHVRDNGFLRFQERSGEIREFSIQWE